jgi:hypothetical protein
MKNSGTRNVGTKLNGNIVMTAIDVPYGLINPAAVPRVTASTKSIIPSVCQRMNKLA